jgi:hypothetical protein
MCIINNLFLSVRNRWEVLRTDIWLGVGEKRILFLSVQRCPEMSADVRRWLGRGNGKWKMEKSKTHESKTQGGKIEGREFEK